VATSQLVDPASVWCGPFYPAVFLPPRTPFMQAERFNRARIWVGSAFNVKKQIRSAFPQIVPLVPSRFPALLFWEGNLG